MLDVKQTLEALDRAVASKPKGFKYGDEAGTQPGRCYYVNPATGGSACIVGAVIEEVSAELFGTIKEIEGGYVGSPVVDSEPMRDALKPYFTPDAIYVLRIAQREQDRRATWERAVEDAREDAESWGGIR